MRLYGIASKLTRNVDEWHRTEAEANATLHRILREAPELQGELWIEAVDFDEPSMS